MKTNKFRFQLPYSTTDMIEWCWDNRDILLKEPELFDKFSDVRSAMNELVKTGKFKKDDLEWLFNLDCYDYEFLKNQMRDILEEHVGNPNSFARAVIAVACLGKFSIHGFYED